MNQPGASSLQIASRKKNFFRAFVIFVAALVFVSCSVALAAWTYGIGKTSTLHIDAVNPMAALCLIFVALAMVTIIFFPLHKKSKAIQISVATFMIVLGVCRLLEAARIVYIKFDTFLFYDSFKFSPSHEIYSRLTYISSLVFVLLGVAILVNVFQKKAANIYQVILLVVIAICFFNITSYIYGVSTDYFGEAAMYRMRLGGAINFILISVCLLVQDRHRGIMATITSNQPGGKIIRLFLPIVILFPVLLGIIDHLADITNLYQDSFGLALSSIAIIIVFLIILYRAGKANNRTYAQLLKEVEERKKAGRQAMESDIFADSIYQSIPHMIFVKDGNDFSFKSINKAGEKLTGYKNEELIGKKDEDLFPLNEATFFREKDKEVFTAGGAIIQEEQITTPEGVRWLRTKKVGVKDEGGNPLYMIGISEDITELKEKQEQLNKYHNELEQKILERTAELRKSEERFQKMVEDVADYSIILLDVEGNVLNWNPGAEKVKGYKAEEIIGKSFETFYTPEDIAIGIPNLLLKRARDKGRVADEGWRVRKDGSRLWAYVAITALKDENGVITGFSKVTRDVTDKKRAEERLVASEKQFQAFMNTLPALAWIVDEEGTFRYTNSLYNTTFNYYEIVGKKIDDLFPQQIASEYLENNNIVFNSNIPLETIEHSIKPDNTDIVLKIFKFPLGENNGLKLLGGIGVDITQMIKTEEALKQANEQIGLFVKHTPAAVAMLDKNMRYIVASDRWYEDYGLEGQEIIGKSHYEIFPEINNMAQWKEIHARCLQGNVEISEKDPFPRKNGKLDWLRWEIHPWRTEEDKVGGIIMFTELITDRIKAEEAMKELNEQLFLSNKELEQFAYVASHDLQEPIRMVSSFLQLLEKKYKDKIDEKASQYISFAVDGAERMKTLINDLLKFSRLGTQREKNVLVDCNDIVQNVLSVYQYTIRDIGAEISISELPVVMGLKSELEQLFQNLIGNALKYRKARAYPIINITCERMDNYWLFKVKDNGIGIDDRYFEKIFIIFQRLHGRNDYSGTGIGLAICKKIVERHGGEIGVKSKLGEGSEFYFTIPAII